MGAPLRWYWPARTSAPFRLFRWRPCWNTTSTSPLDPAETSGAAAAQPAAAERARRALSGDRIDLDREALHRRRDAAIRHHSFGESHRGRSAPAVVAVLGKPGSDTGPRPGARH